MSVVEMVVRGATPFGRWASRVCTLCGRYDACRADKPAEPKRFVHTGDFFSRDCWRPDGAVYVWECREL